MLPLFPFTFRRAATVALLAAGISCVPAEKAPADGPRPRVVALAPSLAELCFALGAGDHVVGVSAYTDRPPEAARLPVVGDAKGVALEALAALEPDLVLVNSEAVQDALGPLAGRFRVEFVRAGSVGDVLVAIDRIGRLLHRGREADALRARIESALRRARRQTGAALGRERVLVVLQRDPFFVAGPDSYLDDLLQALGYANAAASTGASWPTLSAEALIELAPDAIVDAAADAPPPGVDDPDAEARAYWGRFPSLPAVRSGRVRRLRDKLALRPGPSIPEALEALAASIAPPREASVPGKAP